MAFPEFKGIGKKGQAKFRLYYDGPKKPDGSRNQQKESFSVFPFPEKAGAIIKAVKSRDSGTITKTEALLLERFEKQATELADLEARKKEQLINDPNYVEPIKVEPVADKGELFTELSARWFKFKAGTARKGKKRPKTMWRYEQLLERIDEYFKETYVEDIGIDRVEEFYSWLAIQKKKPGGKTKKPITKDLGTLGEQTIWHYHRCLYSILEYGVARGKLGSNPCKYTQPKVPDNLEEMKPDSYNVEQAAEIKALIENEPLKHRIFVSIILEAGPRPEEISALHWSDIDFEARKIDISKTWQYIPGLGNIEEPYTKNKGSRRKVRLSAGTIFLLRQLKGEQEKEAERLGSKWVGSEAVFVCWNGKQVNAQWASIWWRGWVQETKLPVKRLYSLRHTCISLLVEAGANPLEIARMVGHVNAAMIWKIYGHPTQKEDFNGADIMERIMNKAKKVEQKVEQNI